MRTSIRHTLVAVAAVAAVLPLAGCGGDEPDAAPEADQGTASAPADDAPGDGDATGGSGGSGLTGFWTTDLDQPDGTSVYFDEAGQVILTENADRVCNGTYEGSGAVELVCQNTDGSGGQETRTGTATLAGQELTIAWEGGESVTFMPLDDAVSGS